MYQIQLLGVGSSCVAPIAVCTTVAQVAQVSSSPPILQSTRGPSAVVLQTRIRIGHTFVIVVVVCCLCLW